MFTRRILALVAIACMATGIAKADDDNLRIPGNYQESGFGEQHEYQKGQANEYVDPFSGGLKRIYKDYVFRGNGGMDINITRIYNNLQNAGSRDNGKWATPSGGKAYMGPGWDIHFGRIWLPMEAIGVGGSLAGRVIPAWPATFPNDDPLNSGYPQTKWHMNECHIGAWASDGYAHKLPVLELPDGSREVLYPVVLAGETSSYITKNHWVATCLPYSEEIAVGDDAFNAHTQGGLVLHSPTGLRYVFNKKGALTGYGGTYGIGYQEGYVVTKISDLNGNYLDIQYARAFAYDGILRPTTVTAHSGLSSVSATFNYSGSLLSSITGQGVTIDYSQVDGGDQLLRDVNINTGSIGDAPLHWHYDYVVGNAPLPATQHDAPYSLSQVTSPTGQVTTYQYGVQSFTGNLCPLCINYDQDRYSNVVVTGRTVDGVSWHYDYHPGAVAVTNNDYTEVSAYKDGNSICTHYEHIGELATPPINDGSIYRNARLYKRGLLVRKEIYAAAGVFGGCSGSPIQTEINTYGQKAYLTDLDDYKPYPPTRDTRIWSPLLTKKEILRDGKTYTTTTNYVDCAYNETDDPAAGWVGCLIMTNPVSTTTEPSTGQADKVTHFGNSEIFSISGGVSPVLRYKEMSQGHYVVDGGVSFTSQKFYDDDENSGTGNLVATYENGIPTFYEYSFSGDLKKMVTWKNYKEQTTMNCATPSGATFNAQLPGYLSCIASKTSGMTLMQNYTAGVPANITLPDGTTINRQLDNRGNIWQETVSKSGEVDTTTGYTYDLLNRVKSVTTPRTDDADASISYPSFTQTVSTRGRLTKTVTRNTRGLVSLSCTAASDAGTSICQNFAYDPLTNTKTFASDLSYSATETGGVQTLYDRLSRVTSTGHTGGLNPVTYFYNVPDQVRKVERVNSTPFETKYTYRTYGNPDQKFLVKIEAQESGGNYVTTDINKNSVGRLSGITQNSKTRNFHYMDSSGLPMLMNWEQNEYQDRGYCYTYNGKPNFLFQGTGPFNTCSSAAAGSFGYQTYDVMDQISSQQYWAYGNAVSARNRYFLYDKFGNPKKVSLDIGTPKDIWQYSYDLNNNLQSETFTNSEDSPVVNYAIGYQYDDLDGLQQITYPNNQKAIYSPDGFGRAAKVDYDDNAGTVTHLVNTGLSYFANGNLQSFTASNGRTTSYTQTVDKLIDTIVINGGTLSLNYDYDDIGNVTAVADPNPDPLTNLAKSGFQYDGLSRLKAVTLAEGNYGYAYNTSGDITQKTTPQGGCTYNYDPATSLLGSIAGTCGETASSVIYDSLKNVRGKDGAVLYTYNSANQLVRQNGNFYAEYDGNGNRFRSSMQQWNLNGSGAFSTVSYLNLFSKGGKNLVEVDHRVDSTGSYVKKNYRNHVYLGAGHLAYVDDCQINKNLAIGVCGDVDEDSDSLTYLQELDKGTYPFDKDSDHDGIPDFYDLFPTDPNPKFPLESAGGYKGSSIRESVKKQ